MEYNGLEIDSPRKQERPNYQVEDFLTYYRHSEQGISRHKIERRPVLYPRGSSEFLESLLTLICFTMTMTPVSRTHLRMNPCYIRENITTVPDAPYSSSLKLTWETFISNDHYWLNERHFVRLEGRKLKTLYKRMKRPHSWTFPA